jgi:hypothetical protein
VQSFVDATHSVTIKPKNNDNTARRKRPEKQVPCAANNEIIAATFTLPTIFEGIPVVFKY